VARRHGARRLAALPAFSSCGATLIAPDRMLTAAHCLLDRAPSDIRVAVGVDRCRSVKRPSAASVRSRSTRATATSHHPWRPDLPRTRRPSSTPPDPAAQAGQGRHTAPPGRRLAGTRDADPSPRPWPRPRRAEPWQAAARRLLRPRRSHVHLAAVRELPGITAPPLASAGQRPPRREGDHRWPRRCQPRDSRGNRRCGEGVWRSVLQLP
jgi:hypothetical protein